MARCKSIPMPHVAINPDECCWEGVAMMLHASSTLNNLLLDLLAHKGLQGCTSAPVEETNCMHTCATMAIGRGHRSQDILVRAIHSFGAIGVYMASSSSSSVSFSFQDHYMHAGTAWQHALQQHKTCITGICIPSMYTRVRRVCYSTSPSCALCVIFAAM